MAGPTVATSQGATSQGAAPRSAASKLAAPWLATGALLLPVLLLLLVWFLAPLTQLLRLSLSDPRGLLAAYAELIGSEVYRQVFLNTLILAVDVTVLCVVLAYPTAYLLTRLSGWRRAVAFYCVLVPLWVSVLVRTFSWMLLLGTSGPINGALVGLGIVEHPLTLLFNTTGVTIGMVHVLLPYALLPIYSAMLAIEPRLLLASEGLGAGPATTFRRVYLPLTLPGVGAAAAFVFLLALGFFVTPALLGGIQNVTASMLIDNFVNERLVWPLAAAASFCLLALILVLLLAASRFLHLGHMLVAR